MTTWFVSRHPGALQWLEQQGIHVDRCVAHLDPALLAPGDTVIGTLPVHLAAEVCAKNGRYLHLSLTVPENMRGSELAIEDMQACNARLEPFLVARLDS
ncbi:MAG: CRISPR-associated protein Csx16 [Chitinivorax sp.]|jgi:CRISPR-associated protein Csx16